MLMRNNKVDITQYGIESNINKVYCIQEDKQFNVALFPLGL